jgi:hypothetical protein
MKLFADKRRQLMFFVSFTVPDGEVHWLTAGEVGCPKVRQWHENALF